MLWNSRKKHQGYEDCVTVARPTAITLLGRILQSLFGNGMQWLTVPAVLLVTYLYYNHAENKVLTAAVLVGLTAIALVRGCRAWQRDLNDYQRHLSLMRHREWQEHTEVRGSGYFPAGSRRY